MGKHKLELENLSVYDLRKRLFNKQSETLYGKEKSEYTFLDNTPEQIERLQGFSTWETFSKTWDIYWVGFDPRANRWVTGRHNSPIRKVVVPLRIVEIDERNGRMQDTYLDKADIIKMKTPTKKYEETEEDRIISESLSGKVIIDEPDEDKAIRLIEQNMKILQQQLEILLGSKK